MKSCSCNCLTIVKASFSPQYSMYPEKYFKAYSATLPSFFLPSEISLLAKSKVSNFKVDVTYSLDLFPISL